MSASEPAAKKPRLSQAALEARVAELEAQLADAAPRGTPAKCPNLASMLRADAPTYGTLVQSPSPFWIAWGGPFLAAELDFVFIDTEHTPINRHDLSAMCNLYKGQGLPSLVRVANDDEASSRPDDPGRPTPEPRRPEALSPRAPSP